MFTCTSCSILMHLLDEVLLTYRNNWLHCQMLCMCSWLSLQFFTGSKMLMFRSAKTWLYVMLGFLIILCTMNGLGRMLFIGAPPVEFVPIIQDAALQSGFCSDALLSNNPYYQKLMSTYLDAWHKFVPHQNSMDSSNCWYVKNFNSLPANLTVKMKEVPIFMYLQKQFTRADAEHIVRKIFSNGSTAIFTTQPTRHYFCLPNTLLIGFPKTGSTLLYEYIQFHPLMAKPYSKEGQFWRELVSINDSSYTELAILLYLYHFLNASAQIKDSPSMFTIDASVSTVSATSKPLAVPEVDVCIVPLMLSKVLPGIKLLVQLRNPVHQLWSDFLFHCPPDIWDNMHKGLPKTPSVVASVFHNYTVTAVEEFMTCNAGGHSLVHCTALAGSYPGRLVGCEKVRPGISLYYVHLIKWFSVFPRKQLHVQRLEDLLSNPAGTMDKVWAFLGKSLERNNTTAITSKVNANLWAEAGGGVKFKMFPKTEKLLREFFLPYNAKLAKLLVDERYLWTET